MEENIKDINAIDIKIRTQENRERLFEEYRKIINSKIKETSYNGFNKVEINTEELPSEVFDKLKKHFTDLKYRIFNLSEKEYMTISWL